MIKSVTSLKGECQVCGQPLLTDALEPVAWRRTDTAKTLVTENSDIAKGWALDSLPHEPLYTLEQLRAAVAEGLKMNLYLWQPRGYGELSWFVVAENEEQARSAVEAEIQRRMALEFPDHDRITDYDWKGWGTDYYVLTVASPGQVLVHSND